jgi:hypothetical protein
MKIAILCLALFCLITLPFGATNADVVTTQDVNFDFATGQSLIYQDQANSRIVNWTVTSGTWAGTGAININSTAGTLTMTPSSTCTVLMTTTNSYIPVGGIYQTTYSFTFTAGSARTLTWVFNLPTAPTQSPAPSATPPPKYYLFINITGQGTTTPSIGIFHEYSLGEVATLTATPAAGWAFDYWLFGDNTTITDATTTHTMTHDESALAVFTEIPVEGEPTPAPTVPPTPIPTTFQFPNAIDTSYLWQYFNNGDLIGFIIACWTVDLGESFYVIISMIATLALYIRTKSLPLMIAMWFCLGFLWIGLLPMASPIIILLFIFGIASLLIYIYMLSKY